MTRDSTGKHRISIEDKRQRGDGYDGAHHGAQPQAAADSLQSADELIRQQLDAARACSTDDMGVGDDVIDTAPARPAATAMSGTAPDYKQLAAEYLDLAQRKEAELRNYRKRVLQDMDDARRFAMEGLLADLFPAFDGLAQCAHTYRDKADGDDALLDGVRRTIRALEGALAKRGVTKISETGVPFDPHLHHAISMEDSSDVTEETVAEVYSEGFRMGDIVLKPAMVRVVRPASS
jgi:molecular chaperone GrpE (heat shock protein)